MKKYLLSAAAGTLAALLIGGTAALAAGPTLFGDATQNTNAVQLLSNTGNASTTDDYGGVAFGVPGGTTLATLDTLMAQYNVLGTDCGGGSPRFQIDVNDGTTTATIDSYIGPEPNYTGCTMNESTSTGNLIDGSRFVDTSQLAGGTFYDTWAHALSAYGTSTVTGVQIVADGGWALSGGVQRVNVSRVTVGDTIYDLGSPNNQLQDLINRLTTLMGTFPQFGAQIQGLINQLNGMGTTTGGGTTTPPPPPPASAPSIDNNGASVSAGGTLDFAGRNFGREESVAVTLNGSAVATAHADGGGNFSTGSMTAPAVAGTYTYMFVGQTSGLTAASTITVM